MLNLVVKLCISRDLNVLLGADKETQISQRKQILESSLVM